MIWVDPSLDFGAEWSRWKFLVVSMIGASGCLLANPQHQAVESDSFRSFCSISLSGMMLAVRYFALALGRLVEVEAMPLFGFPLDNSLNQPLWDSLRQIVELIPVCVGVREIGWHCRNSAQCVVWRLGAPCSCFRCAFEKVKGRCRLGHDQVFQRFVAVSCVHVARKP